VILAARNAGFAQVSLELLLGGIFLGPTLHRHPRIGKAWQVMAIATCPAGLQD
jgi:hypothetical protein